MSETKKEKLEYILGKKRLNHLKQDIGSLADKIDGGLLDAIYERFKTKERKIKSLKKENDRYSDMRLCTKKGGCKHAIGETMGETVKSDKDNTGFDIIITNAFNRLMRAHFIITDKRKESKYSIRQDMNIFSINATCGEKAALIFAKNMGMSKKTFIVHQKYIEEDFIPHIVSCMITICNELTADLKIDDNIRGSHVMYLCDEYIQTITGTAMSESAMETVINHMLDLHEKHKNEVKVVTE